VPGFRALYHFHMPHDPRVIEMPGRMHLDAHLDVVFFRMRQTSFQQLRADEHEHSHHLAAQA
jgi:hypothetical protein